MHQKLLFYTQILNKVSVLFVSLKEHYFFKLFTQLLAQNDQSTTQTHHNLPYLLCITRDKRIANALQVMSSRSPKSNFLKKIINHKNTNCIE